jgi:hypothetical protein
MCYGYVIVISSGLLLTNKLVGQHKQLSKSATKSISKFYPNNPCRKMQNSYD